MPGRQLPLAPSADLFVPQSLKSQPQTPNTESTTHEEESLSSFATTHTARGVARLSPSIITSAKGSYVYTSSPSRRLLDFTTGIGVVGLGHCHPTIAAAAAEQCLTLVHGQCSVAFHSPYVELLQKLGKIMPHPSLDTFFLSTTGAEAVEGAMKLARTATGRQNIIAFQGGYHGRTMGTMALTRSKISYSESVGPLMGGVYVAPWPYWHQLGFAPDTPKEEIMTASLFQLDLLLKQQTSPKDTAAIILEPVLGEGGYVDPPPGFLAGLRERCDAHGILLILDEVQCGFGRTGSMFVSGAEDVKPDILVMAKGIANGFPLSGIASRKELMDTQPPGSMGGTYAANAVSCAAACAVIDVLTNASDGAPNIKEEEDVLKNVRERGKQLMDALRDLEDNPETRGVIVDVRGRGLMVGVEFATPAPPSVYSPLAMRRTSSLPPVTQTSLSAPPIALSPSLSAASKGIPKNLASRIQKKCLEKGLMILTTSIFEVIRFIPPLNISEMEMEEGLGSLGRVWLRLLGRDSFSIESVVYVYVK